MWAMIGAAVIGSEAVAMIEVEEGSGAGIVGFLLLLALPNSQKTTTAQ